MAKRNQYSFSKRQREIKRKQKAEEKRLRKAAKKEPLLEDGEEAEGEELPDEEPRTGIDAPQEPRPETDAPQGPRTETDAPRE